ncbi:MAG: hypothetical protein KAW01_05640 [Deltaproteobacteria bacterium]|nr:hypothetical protein [Deltaproteobacteria bacterium]
MSLSAWGRLPELKEAVDYYRSKGVSIGLLRRATFYPVCTEELARGIQNAKVVTVMEKTALANERYLLRDVKHAAYNERTGKSFSPVITSGIYGLGSQDFSIEDCFAVIENMLAQRPRGVFGVGIKGPSILPPGRPSRLSGKRSGHHFYRGWG